ncbi:hypothetical protein Plo01_51030 [Planobispora longispora]|uniref:Uncharacterized protein n=1 Tax=Planobispora longispora TaxID=28887 RepID=A0A8J3RPB6_9ACTN|nr:hypothetical protein GCM10020093_055800 [Planobispora longispora]GIH78674.1 hypothetical protein Plo01_51030 [Planobispora longispora]
MVLQRDRQPVGGGPGQTGRLHELRQGSRTGFESVEHENGLVEYADSARVVHTPILPSRHMRKQVGTGAVRRGTADGQRIA